jgi:hypothetical protein
MPARSALLNRLNISKYKWLCCKFFVWTEGSRERFVVQVSDWLEVERFPNERDCLRERRGAYAKRAFDDACLAANVGSEVQWNGKPG